MAVGPDDITIPAVEADPVQSAKEAGLRYVSDRRPGMTRRRAGRGFAYTSANGQKIDDPQVLQRIKSLAIPPAWTEVWISPWADGHIQATGRDARGRKQYRYHPRWRQVRDETKYGRMIAFGKALPQIRARVDQDLALPGLPRDKVLATAVRLLETTLIRVGNEEYARENKHYGLTTMLNRHVKIEGSTVTFKFRGKSGIRHAIDLKDRQLASIVARLQELPGQHLFTYKSDDGKTQTIDSSDVNEYLREITGQPFTAKDFRTWAGTVLASMALQEVATFETKTEAKKHIVSAIHTVSERLGNTPAICRKCYVHPAIIDSYLDRSLLDTLQQRAEDAEEEIEQLEPAEAGVLMLLRRRLAMETEAAEAEPAAFEASESDRAIA